MRDNRTFVRGYFEHIYRSEDPYDIAGDPVEREKRDRTVAAVDGLRFARALEIGGGEGLLAVRLAEQVDDLLMIDLSRRALERARGRLGELANVRVRQLDIVAEPLPGTFDLIVCSEVLIYVQLSEFEEAVTKILAALEPGGYLLLVHSRSIHDDEQGLEYKDFGAKTVHGAFIGAAGMTVAHDETRDMYRVTLLRREPRESTSEA
jgi:predicted TPR repeat methyltransferase